VSIEPYSGSDPRQFEVHVPTFEARAGRMPLADDRVRGSRNVHAYRVMPGRPLKGSVAAIPPARKHGAPVWSPACARAPHAYATISLNEGDGLGRVLDDGQRNRVSNLPLRPRPPHNLLRPLKRCHLVSGCRWGMHFEGHCLPWVIDQDSKLLKEVVSDDAVEIDPASLADGAQVHDAHLKVLKAHLTECK
jgi:hypothetical protein